GFSRKKPGGCKGRRDFGVGPHRRFTRRPFVNASHPPPDPFPMWLVLTDPNDPLAPWLMDGLRRRTCGSVQLLSSRDFLDNPHFCFQPGEESFFELETNDGHFVASRRVAGALNRLRSFSPQTVAHLPPGQRLDAVMTTSALIAGCLRALRCPVLNPPGTA